MRISDCDPLTLIGPQIREGLKLPKLGDEVFVRRGEKQVQDKLPCFPSTIICCSFANLHPIHAAGHTSACRAY